MGHDLGAKGRVRFQRGNRNALNARAGHGDRAVHMVTIGRQAKKFAFGAKSSDLTAAVFQQTEREYSRWNFDVADTNILLQHFEDAEAECKRILNEPDVDPKTGNKIVMAHPAYDQCIKASHLFNLLDARGVISVTERQSYIGRVRSLAKTCADSFLKTEAGGSSE